MVEGGTLRIASRGSKLALWQSHHVRDSIRALDPGIEIAIEIVRTTGDRILDVPLARIGDKGLFTRELDEALLGGRADLAVHSLKDVPTRVPEGLHIAAIPPRVDVADVLIARDGSPGRLRELPPRARVGTSSLRRRAQLKHLRPDVEVLDLRGNVDTRLAKLASGDYDAIILAAAGLSRLGLGTVISERLSPTDWLPAVGQGALAIVTSAHDEELNRLLSALHDPASAACVTAERAFLRGLEGGCQVPIGAIASIADGVLSLDGFVADVDGRAFIRGSNSGEITAAARIGSALAESLLARGAGDLLASVRRDSVQPSITPP